MTTHVSPVSAEELKACPFCGAEPLLHEIAPHTHNVQFGDFKMPDHPGSWTIECPACECGMIADTREKVTSSWSRRTPAASGAKVPGFLVDKAERAIHDATHKKGMQTNGPCMAMIEVSHLSALLRYAMAAAPLPPDQNLNEVK